MWIPQYLNVDGCNRDCHFLRVIARVADGFATDVARDELAALSADLEERFPVLNYGKRFSMETLEQATVGDVRTALYAMLGAVGLVLLIACANVANLLLARSTTRTGEMAMRAALGASRGRVFIQLMSESAVLAFLATTAGLVLAQLGISWLVGFAPPTIPRLDSVTIDRTVVLFTVATGVCVTLLFGLAPALRSTGGSITVALSGSDRGGTVSSNRGGLRSALLVVEMALSMILLFACGILIRSFAQLNSVQLGYAKEDILTFSLSLPRSGYSPDGCVQFYESLEERIETLPGIASVASAYGSPLTGDGFTTSIHFLDRAAPPTGQEPNIDIRVVTPGYHETLGIQLLRGRFLDGRDHAGVTRAAIISSEVAARHYPERDPIGEQIVIDASMGYDADLPWTIVGIVGDTRSEEVAEAPEPEIYVPHAQMGGGYMRLLVRLANSDSDVLSAIRSTVAELDPAVPLRDIQTMAETVDRQLGPTRFYMTLLTVFAGVALTLAIIGLYGVVSYMVSVRTREIGIRIALGAATRNVTNTILAHGFRLALAGVGLGVVGSLGCSRILRSMLYEVAPTDPWTFAAVILLLLLVVAAALVVPSLRASRIEPVEALRAD